MVSELEVVLLSTSVSFWIFGRYLLFLWLETSSSSISTLYLKLIFTSTSVPPWHMCKYPSCGSWSDLAETTEQILLMCLCSFCPQFSKHSVSVVSGGRCAPRVSMLTCGKGVSPLSLVMSFPASWALHLRGEEKKAGQEAGICLLSWEFMNWLWKSSIPWS